MNKLSLKIITTVAAAVLIYLAHAQLFADVPVTVLKVVGYAMVAVSLFYIFYEAKHNYDFFYGTAQSAGSNANGSVVAGVGIGILATAPVEMIVVTAVMVVYTVIICKKFETKAETK